MRRGLRDCIVSRAESDSPVIAAPMISPGRIEDRARGHGIVRSLEIGSSGCQIMESKRLEHEREPTQAASASISQQLLR